MNIIELGVLGLYEKNHAGKENAITRDKFISKYRWFGLSPFLYITDRQFRRTYSQLPIVTCSKGGFYPIRPEEILEYRDYLRKKAIPLFSRFRRVCDAHPDLADDMLQLDLFGLKEIDYTEARDNDR